jgi:hypothetical protein
MSDNDAAIVIGNDKELTSLVVNRLSSIGLQACAVSDPVLGVTELERRPSVKLLFLQSNDADLARTIRALMRVRPNAVVVGLGGPEQDAGFRSAGAAGCLSTNWDRDELMSLLTRRIPSCVGCGIDLPLRSAAPFETLQRYACRFCGERYAGVMREDASADARSNVRPLPDEPGKF